MAATDFSRACAEEIRVAGASDLHGVLYRALQLTGNKRDIMTLDDISAQIAAIDEQAIPHHVIGKELRRMWPQVKGTRPRTDGEQKRLIRGIAPRVHDADVPEFP